LHIVNLPTRHRCGCGSEGSVDALPATIYVVDDDPDICRALGRLLRSVGYRPVIFQSANDFVRAHASVLAGCVILDQAMPDLDGLGVQAILHAADFFHPVIFLTGLATIQLSVDAIKGGAINLLTKPIDENRLLEAIEEALRIDTDRLRERQEHASIVARLATLTPREREVMEHVVNGRMNKQIAGDLGTVEKTIKAHRARIMQKMKVRTVACLVRLASAVGIGSELITSIGAEPQAPPRFGNREIRSIRWKPLDRSH
jgi:FixJ family two-component response regulator